MKNGKIKVQKIQKRAGDIMKNIICAFGVLEGKEREKYTEAILEITAENFQN